MIHMDIGNSLGRCHQYLDQAKTYETIAATRIIPAMVSVANS